MITAPLLACAAMRHPAAAVRMLWVVVLVGAALLCIGAETPP
ncbi:MAG TPA: hypothetical protein VEW06_06345 [Xanthobacteraceae bacterium]|nr:hypothetical protein [Xanthobacteraceae bacterium]